MVTGELGVLSTEVVGSVAQRNSIYTNSCSVGRTQEELEARESRKTVTSAITAM